MTMDYGTLVPAKPSTWARILDVVAAVGAWLMPALCGLALAVTMASTEISRWGEGTWSLPLTPFLVSLAGIAAVAAAKLAAQRAIRKWWAAR